MFQCFVIADDLTGANATGVLLKKMDYKAHTLFSEEAIDPQTLQESDCLLYSTDSRSLPMEQAYQKVKEICTNFQNEQIKLYAKRIDSTLRGNLGSEVDAMLDCLGKDYVAIVAPCFPSSGRVVVGGYMLVNGIPLHKTDIAIDPKAPVKISEVENIFLQQSKYPVASIYMKDMMHGKHYLADLMNEKVQNGNRILIVDCVTQEDLDLIADALITSKLKHIAVDPGVFTATLARKLIVPKDKKQKNKILVVVGSVNPHTKIQMEDLWLSQRIHNEFVKTEELLKGKEQREAEITRVVESILSLCDKNVVSSVTGDGIYPENRIDLQKYMKQYDCSLDDVTEMINTAFAEITYQIFQSQPSFKGLYASGGDITVSICKKSNTMGLEMIDEVLPLAAYGRFLTGELKDIHIITKGGSQGGRDAISQCVAYLKEKLYI